uniref:Zinc finger AN1-type containing 3 n=1 Tax=Varanus komodoensis TaxID=61221 RepID=A0A8D2ITU6_VARKO
MERVRRVPGRWGEGGGKENHRDCPFLLHQDPTSLLLYPPLLFRDSVYRLPVSSLGFDRSPEIYCYVILRSSKTMNLCSKCFADFQKKQPDDESTPSTSNSQLDLFSGETNSDNSNTSLSTQTVNSNQQLSTELNVTSPSKEECGPCTDTAHVSLTTAIKRSCDSDSQLESEVSPEKRPRLLEDSQDRPEEISRSKQKSRRRCFQCQTKLELVQQELGSCRCGYVFCMLHRLPEQHDCTFDHMGRGREEAIMKMVKLDRKVGRSCQRIGEGCS